MSAGISSLLVFVGFELLIVIITLVPFAGEGFHAWVWRMTDPRSPRPALTFEQWVAAVVGAMLLAGVAGVGLWRLARGGNPRGWRRDALPVLWLCAGGVAMLLANVGRSLLSPPAALPAWQVAAWIHFAAAGAIVLCAAAATAMSLSRPAPLPA